MKTHIRSPTDCPLPRIIRAFAKITHTVDISEPRTGRRVFRPTI